MPEIQKMLSNTKLHFECFRGPFYWSDGSAWFWRQKGQRIEDPRLEDPRCGSDAALNKYFIQSVKAVSLSINICEANNKKILMWTSWYFFT